MKGKLDAMISIMFCAFWTAIVWLFGAVTGVLIERNNNRIKEADAEIESMPVIFKRIYKKMEGC